MSNGQTGMQLDCTPGTTVDITADQGNQAAGGLRQMVHAQQTQSVTPYRLYANNSQTPWTTQAVSVSFPQGVQHVNFPIRAVADLTGPTRGGAYSDTVRITVTW